jgi:hypothetical protein
MPPRRTLGANIGPAGRTGGMMAAFGFAVPSPPEPAPVADPVSPEPPPSLSPGPEEPASRPPRRHAPKVHTRRAPSQNDSSDDPDRQSGAVARIATGVSAETLDLAKRAAYWNRETLRSFLEHAIEAAVRRIVKEQGLASLPDPSPLRRGRPPRV